MVVLGVDTGGRSCGVAVWRDGAVLHTHCMAMDRGHAEALVPQIQGLLETVRLRLSDIGLFAVTTGPGAFTGLRIGLATVGGLAMALNRPIVGISSFDAVAHGIPPSERPGRLAVALDSRRSPLFVQTFDPALAPLAPPAAVEPSALDDALPDGPLTIAGNAADRAAEALSRRGDVIIASGGGSIDPAVVASLGARRADTASADPPVPLYLRAPDARPATAPRPDKR